MTTDAKVGLLLGLVFIVIIAFLINGLPDFLKASEGGELVRASAADFQDPFGSNPFGSVVLFTGEPAATD